jgi:hypothetical protein
MLSAAHTALVVFSMRSGQRAFARRSFTKSVYWRKPVLSVEYARRLPSSLTAYRPSAMNFWPFASSFRSSVTCSGPSGNFLRQ